MSEGRRNAAPTVSRTYMHEPDYCAQAIQLLLKSSVAKEAAHPAAPDDVRRDHGAHTAKKNYTRN
jgi:hypothetical protein